MFGNMKQRTSNCRHASCTSEMCRGSRGYWQDVCHHALQSPAPDMCQKHINEKHHALLEAMETPTSQVIQFTCLFIKPCFLARQSQQVFTGSSFGWIVFQPSSWFTQPMSCIRSTDNSRSMWQCSQYKQTRKRIILSGNGHWLNM